jgi:hypothetical protein
MWIGPTIILSRRRIDTERILASMVFFRIALREGA